MTAKTSGGTPPKDDRAGHRQRLRERFAKNGLDGLQDYEAVELLLSYAIMRRDVKPLAKVLLRRYGSVEQLLDAQVSDLTGLCGMGESSALLIRLVREMCAKYLEQRARDANVLDDPGSIEDFARMKLGGGSRETLMTIYLNARSHIIGYDLTPGTVDRTAIYLRELARKALVCNATAVVLAHNHPSGICLPSPEDVKLTASARIALATFGIDLLDHLVVTPSECRHINPETSLNNFC